MLKKCIIFEDERELGSIKKNQVMSKSDYSESGLLLNKYETLVDQGYVNIFISGIYNADTNETSYGVLYEMGSTEILRYTKKTKSYFSSVFETVDNIKTRKIIGELDSLVCTIGDCYRNRIDQAVIFCNNSETFQWISGLLLPDSKPLSKLRSIVMLDAEILRIEFSKIISPSQINYNAIAKQLAEIRYSGRVFNLNDILLP